MCFWPIVQTLNFAYVAERNRVVVVSAGSFVWTAFLSYMHHSGPDALFRPTEGVAEGALGERLRRMQHILESVDPMYRDWSEF